MNKSTQISFRISEDVARRLDQVRGNRSRGDYVRTVLTTGLDGKSPGLPSKQFAQLCAEVQQLCGDYTAGNTHSQRQLDQLTGQLRRPREDLAMATAGILTRLGQKLTDQEAEEFVRRTLLSDTEGLEAG